ncbi:MAG: AEC family transporter [Lachnospiraceae bacterium]|nr:AEC family transporter [Lachnospiraceae bacterium]
MSIWIVQKQMIVIFVMILIGAYLYKKKHLSNESSKDLSWLIVNVTNPITLLCSALSEEEKVSAGELGIAFLSFAVMYAILIPLAYLIPMLLNVDRDRRYAYRMLAIFGNVGFIGIPFASAVLGPKSLIFVSICCLVFNIIIYTYGVASLKAVAEEQHPDEDKGDVFSAKNIINSGTVMSVVTIVVYLLDIKMPDMIDSTLNYIANCTTFLSMIVLGVSVAQMVPKEVFTRWRLYVFLILRQILVPVLFIFVMRMFITNELILKTIAVMAAMPAANMPLMMAKQYGVKEDMISAGIILTTLTSIFTIPAVMYFL